MLLQSIHWGNNLDELKLAINTNIVGVEVSVLHHQDKVVDGYLAHAQVEDLQVSFIRYGAGVHVQCQQDDVYCFVIPYGGECCIRHNKINVSQDQRMQLLPPVAELDMKYSGDCGHLVLRFKRTPFHEAIFETLFAESPGPRSETLSGMLRSNCALFLACCEFAHDQTHMHTLIERLKQSIYELMLNSEDAKIASLPRGHPRTKLAVEFIKEHPQWEYSIGELSHLLGWSARSLYGQFKRQTGTTPYRYYQNMKLCRARLDLLKYGRSFSVTEIASHNGFTHLGRFASQYRRLFGERPNETLLRSQGRK